MFRFGGCHRTWLRQCPGSRDGFRRYPRAVDLGLKGRTALVCGASSGLGLASAEALVEEGANVVLFARQADELEAHAVRLGGVPWSET